MKGICISLPSGKILPKKCVSMLVGFHYFFSFLWVCKLQVFWSLLFVQQSLLSKMGLWFLRCCALVELSGLSFCLFWKGLYSKADTNSAHRILTMFYLPKHFQLRTGAGLLQSKQTLIKIPSVSSVVSPPVII